MTLSQMLSIVRARWVLALSVLMVTLVATLVVSLLLPKQYLASAQVVVDTRPDPIAGVVYPGVNSPTYVLTQVDVIRSRRVLLRAIRNLKLPESQAVREGWLEATQGEGSIESWLVDSILKSLEVVPSVNSNVVAVNVTSTDPRNAAALANAIVLAYLQTTLEMQVDPAKANASFFDKRVKEARDTLEAAQSKLSSFQREKGIIASDERLDVETARLSDLSQQLVAVQMMLAESSSRQAQAQGASSDRLQEVIGNPLLTSLKADLGRNEAKLQELSSRYGDRHPQVIELKASTAELRSRLETETRRVTGSVGVTNNITRQREAEIRAVLEAQRAKVLRLKAVRDEGAVLLRDVESAQRAYDVVAQRLNQTSMESLSTAGGNVSRLSDAEPPLAPASPNIALNLALAAALGMLLALGTGLGAELLDRRVRTIDDVTVALGLPVLGVLPRPGGRHVLGKRRALLMRQNVLGLPALGKEA